MFFNAYCAATKTKSTPLEVLFVFSFIKAYFLMVATRLVKPLFKLAALFACM